MDRGVGAFDFLLRQAYEVKIPVNVLFRRGGGFDPFSASRLVRWLLGFSACWLLGLPCGFSASQVTMGFNSKVYWLMYTFTYDYLGYPHDLGKRPYWFFNFSVSKEFDPNTSDKRLSIYGRNQCLSAQGIRISRPARGAPRHRRGWLLHLICGHPSMDPWFIQMNMD